MFYKKEKIIYLSFNIYLYNSFYKFFLIIYQKLYSEKHLSYGISKEKIISNSILVNISIKNLKFFFVIMLKLIQ